MSATEGGVLAVVGNPRPGSRTAAVAVAVAEAVVRDLRLGEPGGLGAPELIDLGELLAQRGAPLGADSAERYAEPLVRLHAARFLVVATPTYKGSYTGLLKSFLDHVAAGALRGAVAVPLITVGSPAHTLAADVHVRPLLQELGAVLPTPALVVPESELADPAAVIDAWLERSRPALTALLRPASASAAPAVAPSQEVPA